MRPRLALSLLAGLAVIAGTAACSDDNNGNPPTADITITTGASTKTTTAFSPNPFTMSPGDERRHGNLGQHRRRGA